MTKLVIYDIEKKIIIYLHQEDTSPQYEKQCNSIVKQALKFNRIKNNEIKCINTTGYGRNNYINKSIAISEIICHARGVVYFNKDIKTIIDIGGQDSKIIKLNNGKVVDFVMNDKCAAGTGRFIEKLASIFNLNISELDTVALQSKNDLEINSTCVVFAESEIINNISNGVKKEDIIAAVLKSISHRIISLAANLHIEPPVTLVGGLGKIITLTNFFQNYLKYDIFTPEFPEFTGALGAAIGKNS